MYDENQWRRLIVRIEIDIERRLAGLPRTTEFDDDWAYLMRAVEDHAIRYLPVSGWIRSEDVDDIVQSILVKFQDISTLRKISSARSYKGYIITMIRNEGLNVIRRRARIHSRTPSLKRELARRVYLDKSVRLQEHRINALYAVLERLSDEELDLLVMRFWKQMKIKQIARIQGVKYSTMASRMIRLLAKMRYMIEGFDDDFEEK